MLINQAEHYVIYVHIRQNHRCNPGWRRSISPAWAWILICHKRDACVCREGRLLLAAGLTFRYLFSSVFSSSVNNLECIINRTPSGISREKLEPLPAVISTVKWVCFQYSNWSWFI